MDDFDLFIRCIEVSRNLDGDLFVNAKKIFVEYHDVKRYIDLENQRIQEKQRQKQIELALKQTEPFN